MSGENSALMWLPALGGLVVKSLLVFLIAGAALLALRRASASARHLVCLLTLAGLLALPVLSVALPGWRLAVLKGEPTPQIRSNAVGIQVAAPPETGGGRVLDVGAGGAGAGMMGAASGAPMPIALTSSSSRSGRTPVSGANKEVGPFPWLSLLLSCWLGGVLLSLLRPLLGLWGIGRLSQESSPILDAPTLALAAECAAALGLARTPALRSADAPVPMTWGWRRPVVLLPEGARDWTAGRLRAVLLHELAHVRRRDWLSHRMADAVCALYWFHPLVWLTARRLRAEGEIACDDLVLTAGVAAPDYARHLLDVARALRPVPAATVPQAAIAMARTARIEGRLRMILDNTRPRRALTRRALLLALTPGAAALVTLAVLRPAVRAQAAPASVAAAPAPVLMPVAPAAPPVKPTDRAWPAKAPAPPPLLKPVRVAPPRAAPFVAQVAPAAPARPNGPAVSRVTTHAPAAGGRAPLLFTASRVTAGASRGAVKPQSPAFSFSSDLALNGTTLLAGVTDADKPGGPWWSASGASLPIPVYDTAKYRAESHVFGGSTRNVILAFRLPGATDGATLAFKTPGALGSSSEGSWLFKMQGREHLTEAQAHLRSGGARVLTVAFPASLTKTDVQIGVASGPWKVAASCGLGEFDRAGGASVKDGGSTFVFSPMSETKGGTVVSIATDATDDLRVVAVGADGRESLPDQPGDNSMGALDQITVRFALPLAQIKEVRVETRTFRWVEIKGIALQPAH